METPLKKRAQSSGAEVYLSPSCETLRFPNHLNPLLVDLILDKIFHFIIAPIQKSTKLEKARISNDVKNFRLVCKLWRARCTAIFRKLRPLFELYEGGFKDHRFVNVMRESEMNPVQRYLLCDTFLTEKNRPLVQELLRVCGPEMVELRLSIYGLVDPFQEELSNTGVAFPKLQKLDAYIHTFNWKTSKQSEMRLAADILAFLLRSVTNLQHFKLDFVNMNDAKGYLEMMRLIPRDLQTCEIKLKNISNTALEILAERNANWKTFRILDPKVNNACAPDAARKFFTGITESLETLRWPASEATLFSEEFPSLPKLTELSLDCRPWWKCMPISFPVIFPNLVEVSFEHFNNTEELLKLLSTTKPSPSVEKITFPEYNQTVQLVNRAAICFPNVKRLSVISSNRRTTSEILQEVFTSFPDIEELKIVFLHKHNYLPKMDGDAMLSGLARSDCQNIRENADFQNINLDRFERKPSILQLKGLRKLELQLQNKIWFSDFSAHLIFLKMDKLKVLRSNCGFRQMSTGAIQLLKDKLDEFEVRDIFESPAFVIEKNN